MARGRTLIAVVTLAPICAVLPPLLDLSGAWVALHLAGGATALALLVWSAWTLGGRSRWLALGAVATSLVAISIVTGGGSIAVGVQWAILVVLGSIYVWCVWRAARAPAA